MKPYRLLQTIAISLAVVAGLPDAAAQVNAEQVLAIGRNVLSMEDYMLSIHYFNQAIGAKPYLSDPYFYRALAKLNLDDFKGAEEDCTAAIERNKFKTEAYKLRGFARQQMGLDSLAVADYDVGLAANPYDRYFLYYKGVAQTERGKYAEADSVFALLLKSHPKFDEGVAARGRLNLLRGDTLAALADADRAINLNRTLLNPWLLKSQIHADRRQWDEALTDMDEAIRIRPEEPGFYINRAYLRYNADNFFGAMADYNYSLQLDPSNVPALFNRALLRLEVKDLAKAVQDFSEVLRLQPGNFHALYNRGLANLELGNPRKALEDFRTISVRFPRFYPVYYAIAECYRQTGNLRLTAENIKKADAMVSAYVADPNRNPLDRPAISQGNSRKESRNHDDSPDDHEQAMEEFDRLVTVPTDGTPDMAFNDRIRGRVQDRNVAVEPEPPYTLSLNPPAESLGQNADTFRELGEFNSSGWTSQILYLGNSFPTPDPQEFERLQTIAAAPEQSENPRPADWFLCGVARSMLKDYSGAVEAFDKALSASDDFALALLGRGTALGILGKARNSLELQLQGLRDLEKVVELNPNNPYAWFDKANIHYAQRDYSEALDCFDKAIKAEPKFGAAWYNRALCLLQGGNRREALASLSKAGELGVLPSYNLLKRMN